MAAYNIPPNIVAQAKGNPINRTYRINLHFHPDMPYEDVTVIENIARTKRYFSQFVTRVSNGRLVESSTDDRILWERQLFAGLYDTNNDALERPKYGALGFLDDLYGTSPRFGSCYLRLKEHMLDQATFCFPESSIGPRKFGTSSHFDLIDLARNTPMEEVLDWYIEAHIHGSINVLEDVEALVLDPSYRGTNVERAALQLGCDILWHRGYEVLASDLREHKDYRGSEIVEVAGKLADGRGMLTPAILGMAYRDSSYPRQTTKKVWHCLARFGRQNPWYQAMR